MSLLPSVSLQDDPSKHDTYPTPLPVIKSADETVLFGGYRGITSSTALYSRQLYTINKINKAGNFSAMVKSPSDLALGESMRKPKV